MKSIVTIFKKSLILCTLLTTSMHLSGMDTKYNRLVNDLMLERQKYSQSQSEKSLLRRENKIRDLENQIIMTNPTQKDPKFPTHPYIHSNNGNSY